MCRRGWSGKLRTLVQGGVGGLGQKRTVVYRVGGRKSDEFGHTYFLDAPVCGVFLHGGSTKFLDISHEGI